MSALHQYLVFDTETNGLPRDWKAPITDTDNWPRLVQLAWAIYDQHGQLLERQSHIIRPDGFLIPEDAALIHGISHARALREGVRLAEVLDAFVLRLHEAELLVAHNIAFDAKIIGAELYRASRPQRLDHKRQLCTMQASTDYCRLPGRYGSFKWPTLTELHTTLFDQSFDGAHDALVDVEACARCFFELQSRGVVA
jgi:DNA polymerase-3 subunit epsilon